jgi:hypothetical protein
MSGLSQRRIGPIKRLVREDDIASVDAANISAAHTNTGIQ